MIITCPSCNKKFEINASLIPDKGRTLQCGSCNHQWFFKEEMKEEFTEKPSKTKLREKKIEISREDLPVIYEKKTSYSKTIYKIFSYLIVFIISIVALIIFLDTFKNNLTSIFPELELVLYNLFESIKDIKLFLNDLIK